MEMNEKLLKAGNAFPGQISEPSTFIFRRLDFGKTLCCGFEIFFFRNHFFFVFFAPRTQQKSDFGPDLGRNVERFDDLLRRQLLATLPQSVHDLLEQIGQIIGAGAEDISQQEVEELADFGDGSLGIADFVDWVFVALVKSEKMLEGLFDLLSANFPNFDGRKIIA
jgi:hypothetical protein